MQLVISYQKTNTIIDLKINIMKNTIQILILLISITISAQDIAWEKTFGGKHADYLYDAMPTFDYGFIMVGGTLSNASGDVEKNNGDYDYLITKISEHGDLEWVTTLGGEKQDIIKSITNTYDGGYLLAGISNSAVSNDKTSAHIGMQDIWLVKITITGAIAWQKTIGGLANENINSVIRTKDGNFIIAGTSASDGTYYDDDTLIQDESTVLKEDKNYGNLDYWVLKVDKEGALLWQKTYGGKYRDVLQKVIELPTGNLLLAGTSNSPMSGNKRSHTMGLNDWWVLQLDKEGSVIWQQSYGTDGDDQLTSCLLTKDQNILLGGSQRTFDRKGADASDFALIKIDSLGTIVWENTYDEGKNDILTDVVQNNDGTLLLSGYTASTNKHKNLKQIKPSAGSEDFFVLKLQADGEEDWRKSIGTAKKEVLKKTIETRDGGYVLMGSRIPFNNTGNNDANFYMVKLLDQDKPKPKKLPLEAIPNPTRAYTQIVLGADYETGTVLVSDCGGRVLQQFAINGKRMIPINLEKYADGIYIISVETNIDSYSAKVIKTKM